MTRNIHMRVPLKHSPFKYQTYRYTTLRSLELRSISLYRMSIAMDSNKFKIYNNNIVNKTYLTQIPGVLLMHVFTHALYKNMCIHN